MKKYVEWIEWGFFKIDRSGKIFKHWIGNTNDEDIIDIKDGYEKYWNGKWRIVNRNQKLWMKLRKCVEWIRWELLEVSNS